MLEGGDLGRWRGGGIQRERGGLKLILGVGEEARESCLCEGEGVLCCVVCIHLNTSILLSDFDAPWDNRASLIRRGCYCISCLIADIFLVDEEAVQARI